MVCEISHGRHGPMHLGAPHGRGTGGTGIFPEMCSMDHAALRLVQFVASSKHLENGNFTKKSEN